MAITKAFCDFLRGQGRLINVGGEIEPEEQVLEEVKKSILPQLGSLAALFDARTRRPWMVEDESDYEVELVYVQKGH